MNVNQTEHVTNEEAFTMIEHAIDYLGTRGYPDDGILLAVCTLLDAHKAIGLEYASLELKVRIAEAS